MQALWTAASGLASQQRRIDVLSNNIANSDTVGYKSQDVSFQDLLYRQYDQSQQPSMGGLTATQMNSLGNRIGPTGLPLGSGTRITPLMVDFTKGSMQTTDQPLDFAIQGNSFFAVQVPAVQGANAQGTNAQGTIAYTRNGHFQLSQDPADGKQYLATEQGYKVLDPNGQPIDLTGVDLNSLQVQADGSLVALQDGKETTVGQLGLNYIDHPEADLQPAGNNIYQLAPGASTASIVNQLTAVTPQDYANLGTIRQKALEQSNVDLTTQMTNLIETQRSFDLDAKAVTTADQMMGIANNLRS